MGLSNEELLRKAVGDTTGTLTTAEFGDTGGAPLTIEQVAVFYQVAIDAQIILPDVRTVMNAANKWQESKLDFSSRVLRPGIEGARLESGDRSKPVTGVVEMSTVLVRGEVPITDEVLEDNVERAGFSGTLQTMIAQRVGRDLEELFLNGDINNDIVGHDDSDYMNLLDGWIKQAYDDAGSTSYDAEPDGQDFQVIFAKMLQAIPDRFKKDKPNMRFYVPSRLDEKYRDSLTARGTPLGDLMLEGDRPVKYQGIPIMAVPIMNVKDDETSFILLCHRLNLMAGYRRMVKFESFRDPREGQTSYIVTCRVDAKVEHLPATALAYNVLVAA